MRGEFELIARYFAPLAAGEAGALGLADDAAVVRPPADRDLVYTLDTIVAGVHYLPDDPPDLVARKLLRVNLSDLAAMGARPRGYLLSTALARDAGEDWIAGFAEGLRADQDTYGIGLLGGDTTAMPGPTTLSMTAIGEVPCGRALRRSGGRPGDALYVSGRIGDSALGLKVALGELAPDDPTDQAALMERYRLPQPRLGLGQALLERDLARAALDVSDGLIADLGHLCSASGTGAEITAAAVPLSAAAQRLVERDSDLLTTALTGGDDYELAFAAVPENADALAALAAALDLPLTRIGRLTESGGVRVVDGQGGDLDLTRPGWTHF